jgi:NAD(P) transhydrogenase
VQAAKAGRRAAVLERHATVGGVSVETGTIPSKTFREAVTSFGTLSGSLERHGMGRTLPRATAEQLLARVGEVMGREREVQEHQLRRNGVEVIGGCASFIDPHTMHVASSNGGRQVSAEHVLVAVGTRPAEPAGARVDGVGVMTSDHIATMTRIPRTLAVVGAGVIGIEYASIFAALGTEVTLIDRRHRPLEFIDSEIVDELLHQLRKRNVAFRPGEAVERLEHLDGPSSRVAVWLESGKRVVADTVLFAVGRVGATDDLELGRAGVAVDNRGRIVVDKEFRTSVPHIFAAGDVIGHPSLAATSSEQGRLASCHALGIPARPMAAHFPIGLYAVPEVSMVGAPEQELTEQKVPYEVGVARYREIARGHILGDDSGFFKMLFHRDDRRLLGVHIIGTQATELVHIGQAVLGLGGGLDYFLETVFNYPTLAECYKVAALNAANKLAS